MKHEKYYEALISDEGIPLFFLYPKENKPEKPIILYDGGQHATFYRQPKEVILLDYLHSDIQVVLKKAPFALVIEINEKDKTIVADYRVEIKIVKYNPLTDGLD